MAISPTPRLGLPYWSEGTDAYPGREGWNQILDLIDDNVAIALSSGPRSNRPQSGASGRFYLATDEGDGGRLYFDGGTGWIELNTNGGGGVGRPLTVGTVGTEGTSPRSARADHTHPIPLATSTVDGLMPRGMADMLQKANANYTTATVLTLAMRNWRGAIQVNSPMDPMDCTNKQWVEKEAGTYQATPDTLVRRYTNGHFRVPSTGHGPDDAISVRYIDNNSSWDNIGGTLVRRGSDGTFYVAEPTKPSNPATKRYADSVSSKEEWKENVRPLDYGLGELRQVNTLLFDYKKTAPEVGTDVAGAFVEQIAALMPRMATYNAAGTPERIKDRELFWVAVQALQQLAESHDELALENAVLRGRIDAIEAHLGLDAEQPPAEA